MIKILIGILRNNEKHGSLSTNWNETVKILLTKLDSKHKLIITVINGYPRRKKCFKTDLFFFRFYRGAIGALLVYDITNPSTFESLESWLDELQVHDEDTVIMLLGNKCDLGDKREVPANKAELFAGKLG